MNVFNVTTFQINLALFSFCFRPLFSLTFLCLLPFICDLLSHTKGQRNIFSFTSMTSTPFLFSFSIGMSSLSSSSATFAVFFSQLFIRSVSPSQATRVHGNGVVFMCPLKCPLLCNLNLKRFTLFHFLFSVLFFLFHCDQCISNQSHQSPYKRSNFTASMRNRVEE